MNSASRTRSTAVLVTIVMLLALFAPGRAAGATWTWTGTGGDALWSNANNWNPAGVPGSGDLLTFPTGPSVKMLNNDLPAGTSFGSITMSGGGYTLNGNAITLTGGIGGAFCCSAINLPITLGANQSFARHTYTNVNVNGYTLTAADLGSYSGVSGSGSIVAGSDVTFSGTSTFSGSLKMKSTGYVSGSMPSLSSLTPNVTLSTLIVTAANLGSAAVTSNAIEHVSGTSTVGTVTAQHYVSAQGGTLNTGAMTTTILYVDVDSVVNSGNLNAGLQTAINGSTPGVTFGQVNVTGTVALTGRSLNLSMAPSFIPSVGQEFVLIGNDGADAVTGTFSGYAQGATITLNGVYQFVLSYHGGDGNDVTVTCTVSPKLWTGAVDANWSNAGNWTGGVPGAGDPMVFPTSAVRKTVNNDLAPGTSFGALGVNGSGYTFNGNAITLTGGIGGASCCSTFNLPITLGASQSFARHTFTDVNVNGYTLTVADYSNYSGVSGSGSIVAGTDVTFSGTSTFSGSLKMKLQGYISGSMASLSSLGPNGTLTTLLLTAADLGTAAVTSNFAIEHVAGPSTLGSVTVPYLYSYSGTLNTGSISATLVYVDADSTLNCGNYNASLQTAVNGLIPGFNFSQVNVTGSVNVTGRSLNLSMAPALVPSLGQEFVLIANDGADAVTGNFSGYAQGATITLNGTSQFTLRYDGGDGNDVSIQSLNGRQAPAIELTSSRNPAEPGDLVTFTATVGGTIGNGTGNVSFYDGTTLLGTHALSGGSAAHSTTSLSAAWHTIRAEYAGDSNYGSGLASLAQEVATNFQPVLDPVGDRDAVAGAELSFTLGASDPDDDPLTFSATGLPAGATLDEHTGAFAWTPGKAQTGSHPVTFTVSDGAGGQDSETITIRVTLPAPRITSRTIGFDVYNQGTAFALPSRVRAVLSDHDSLAAHALGTGHDQPLELALAPPLSCAGAGCTPALGPGEAAHYGASFETPAGGFGRLVRSGDAGNHAVENAGGGYDLVSSDSTFSRVSFLFGRHLWVEADAARDLDGAKLDESGQVLDELLANDAQRVLVTGAGPSFGALTLLAATFTSSEGGSGDGTPRLEVFLEGHGRLVIRLGNAPLFSDGDAALNAWSGVNLIGNGDAGRYGLAGMIPPGADSATYAEALAAAGAFTIIRVDFVADSGPAHTIRLDSIDLGAD